MRGGIVAGPTAAPGGYYAAVLCGGAGLRVALGGVAAAAVHGWDGGFGFVGVVVVIVIWRIVNSMLIGLAMEVGLDERGLSRMTLNGR